MTVIQIHDNPNLIPTSEFKYAKFPFEYFNTVQSAILEHVSNDTNITIASATSSGKTVMAELYMADEIRRRKGKSLYIGPLKALANEKQEDWTAKDHHFSDLNISICTGDHGITKSRINEMNNADVIVMTPEMLASRCRNQKSEKSTFLKEVGTIVFDESHLLTVPNRGDHIEVAIMKMVQINPAVRIVFLSATMPNVKEICSWLTFLTNKDTVLIESQYRPCPLKIHYETYWDGGSYDDKERSKIGTAAGIVNYYPNDKFLIFVHTKNTGKLMVETLKEFGIESEFHNADLTAAKRDKLEKAFKNDPNCRVIIATSTLAWGCYKHGSRVVLPNGSLKDVADIKIGDELLCPVNDTFLPRKVIREKSFKSKNGYLVSLECGDSMIVSCDHVFLATKNRSNPDWVKVSELSKKDFIAVPSDLKLWNEPINDFNKFWYFIGFAFGDGNLCDCGFHANGSKKAVLDLCLGKHDMFADYIIEEFCKEFNYKPRVYYDLNGVLHLSTKKKEIVDHFLNILPLGRKNGKDDLPLHIMDNQLKIRSFLRGLFDADGGTENHSNNNISVGLTNISRKAIESIRTLLLGFGIRSSFGRKKMKDTIINGRYQKAVRKYSYRLRIFGSENLKKYRDHIGFSHFEKSKKLDDYLMFKNSYSKDLIPARGLIKKHLKINNLKAKDFKNITKCDLWNSINKQDCRRDTILKLIECTTIKSELNDLFEKPYYWSKIKEIKPCNGGNFKEIEVEDPHAYIGCGVISHNCNLPARRVIIAGIHRGLTVVENYDIGQMCGRAGRPKYDPRGDVYILVPECYKEESIARLQKSTKIVSQLLENSSGHYKTLAFHVVSEIHHKCIQTKEGFHKWFSNSLAHFQDQKFNDSVIDNVIDLLIKTRCITIEDGLYQTTSIGTIASMFYFSPFDVADLRRNFKQVFEKNQENNDLAIAVALGNIDNYRYGIVNKNEKAEIANLTLKIEKIYGKGKISDSCIKAACAYYKMMTGQPSSNLSNLQSQIRLDLERTMEVIGAIDQMSTKWNKKDYFKDLGKRISYGVKPELLDLIALPGVGKARAERLHAAGVSIDKINEMTDESLSNIMKYKNILEIQKIKNAAKLYKLKEML